MIVKLFSSFKTKIILNFSEWYSGKLAIWPTWYSTARTSDRNYFLTFFGFL